MREALSIWLKETEAEAKANGRAYQAITDAYFACISLWADNKLSHHGGGVLCRALRDYLEETR